MDEHFGIENIAGSNKFRASPQKELRRFVKFENSLNNAGFLDEIEQKSNFVRKEIAGEEKDHHQSIRNDEKYLFSKFHVNRSTQHQRICMGSTPPC